MLRPTGRRFPQDPETKTGSGLPWGACVTPLAPAPAGRRIGHGDLTEAAVEGYRAAAAGVAGDLPRCDACGGYVSLKCGMNARYWRCSLCAAKCELHSRYAPVVLAGEGEALELVPELAREVYEVEVDDVGDGGDVPPVAYIFVVDVGGDGEYFDAMRVAVKSALDAVEGESLVGVLMYDEYVTLLDVREEPLFRRVSAVDPGAPLVDGLSADQWLRPTTSPGVMTRIIDALASINPLSEGALSAPRNIRRAMGAAVRGALDMVEAAGLLAARVIVLGAGMPSYGPGAIAVSASTPEDAMPAPSLTFYSEQGARAAVLGAMVDVYMVSRSPADIATIAPLAQMSGGRALLYESAANGLVQDVWQHLNEISVVRGLLRLRTSPEFAVSELYGCGLYRDHEVPDVYRLSTHGAQSTLAADFEFTSPDGFTHMGGRLPTIQLAFRCVYIEPGKMPRRLLRVETQSYQVTASRSSVRREADANATMTLLFHKALVAADEQGISEARMLLFDWLAELLVKAAAVGEDNELKVDPTLSKAPAIMSIPRLVFGLIRSALFRQESVGSDQRQALRCIWEDLSPEWLAAAAYPRLVSFLSLDEKSARELPLSMLAVRESGHPVFLLDAFSEVVVYYASAGAGRRDLPFPPPESSSVMKFRTASTRNRPVTPHCVVCREGTPKDLWFKSLLIEDATPGAAALSFSAFIQGIVDSCDEVVEGEHAR